MPNNITLDRLEAWQAKIVPFLEAQKPVTGRTPHRMGGFWIPSGNRAADYDYFRRLRPGYLKVVTLSRDRIGEALGMVHEAGAVFIRDHEQSEQQADFAANPAETGRRHAREWIAKLTGGGSLAGLPLNKIGVVLLNEPSVHNAQEEQKLVAYTREALLTLQPTGIRAMVYNLSSGWVRNSDTDTVKNTKPIWTELRVLEDLINITGSWMGLHEYCRNDPDEGWYTAPNGERWGWNMFRHWACPMTVKIIIGECGMSKRINGKPAPGQPVGWVGNVTPASYAEMLWRYERQCHPNVEAIMPFTTNYEADWQDKDTLGAHEDILSRIRLHTWPAVWPVPVIPTEEPPVESDKNLVIFPRYTGKITGSYGTIYKGSYAHEGMDISTGTGMPIYAAYDGICAYADYEESTYGWYVRLYAPEINACFFYAHMMEKPTVQTGNSIKRGQLLGRTGATGNTGVIPAAHLHFEVRVMNPNGTYKVFEAGAVPLHRRNGRVDPLGWIEGWKAMGGKVEER